MAQNIFKEYSEKESDEMWERFSQSLFGKEEEHDVEALKNLQRIYDVEGKAGFLNLGPRGEELVKTPISEDVGEFTFSEPEKPFDPSKDRGTATDMIQYYMNMFGEDNEYDPTEVRRLREANRIARGMGAPMPKDMLGETKDKHPDSPSWSDELSEWEMKTHSPKYYSEHIENLEKVLEGDLFGVDKVRVYKTDLPMIKNYIKAVQAGFEGGEDSAYTDWFKVNAEGNLEINPEVQEREVAKGAYERLQINFPLPELEEALERMAGYGIDINVLLAADAVFSQIEAALQLTQP